MSASNAAIDNPMELAEHDTSEQPADATIVMFVEGGSKTDKYGWLNAFDELAEYLGRMP